MRGTFLPLSVTLAVVLGGQAVLCVVVGLVGLRKLRRDRWEQASVRRRAEFAAAVHGGNDERLLAIARACVRDSRELADLMYVLRRGERLTDQRRAALRCAATRAGLVAYLRAEFAAHRPTARGVAMLALSALGPAGAEADVARMLRDPDPDVRLAACAALAEFGTEAAARALIDALEHSHLPPARIVERLGAGWAGAATRAALAAAISRPQEALDPDRPCPDSGRRAQLASALGIAGYCEAEPELLALLAEGDEEERISASRALGRVGTQRSIPALINALGSEANWPLRACAAQALGRLRAVDATRALAECLPDPAWWVRKQAARALRRLGSPGFAELQAALGHEDRYARERAAEELSLAEVARDAARGASTAAFVPERDVLDWRWTPKEIVR